jgi:transmembrane sensor
MDQAIAWHVGLETAGAEEWRAFVAWLDADPAHREAYDRLTLVDSELTPPAEYAPVAPPVPRRVWPQRVMWGVSTLAAAAAAWIALVPQTGHSALYAVETAPGAHREVTLADGTRVALNGGTRLVLDHADSRRATLERGEAMFDVVHHADQPFELIVGGVTLRDVGTRFNVKSRSGNMEVAVAEGAVLFQPDAEAVALTRGMSLAQQANAREVRVSRVDADAVGGWQRGVLDFREVPLGVVAEDVSRSTGEPIRVAVTMAEQPFTGTLRIDRAPGDIVASLAALAGGSSRRDGPSWVIEPTSPGAR